jgi:hypothetical protein
LLRGRYKTGNGAGIPAAVDGREHQPLIKVIFKITLRRKG